MDTQRKDKAEKWWKLATIFLWLATISGILAFIECIKNA